MHRQGIVCTDETGRGDLAIRPDNWALVQVLQGTVGKDEEGKTLLEGVEIEIPRTGEDLKIGRRSLRIVYATTPRYPELLCVYERTTRRLFSSCFFSAHVNPQQVRQVYARFCAHVCVRVIFCSLLQPHPFCCSLL